MSIGSWEKLIALPNPDFRVLIEPNPKKWLPTGDAWTNAGVSTYFHDCAEEKLNGVTDNGQEMTERNSVSAVQANPGSWYFDFYDQKLYVRCFDSDDLSNSSTDVTVVLFCWKYWATDTVELDGHQYRSVIKQDSLPGMGLAVDDIVEGIYKFDFGSFRVMNDGWFDKAADEYLWLNSRVLIWLGGEALPKSEYCLYFVGRISDFYVSDEEIIISVKDIRVGTYSQLPIDHYWKDNYPNLLDEDESKPIPIRYGKKENVIPINVDPDDEYTSHDSNNKENDTTFEVQEDIAIEIPSSGTIVVIGNSDESYNYQSWSGKVFNLSGGVDLSRDYTDVDKVYIVGTNNWKIAGHKLHAIIEARKNDEVLAPGSDYIPNLINAEFVLKVPFDRTLGDFLEVDIEGKENADTTLMKHGADIALDILKVYLGFIDDELNLDSFNETNAVRTYELCPQLEVDESSREILQTIGRSIVAFFSPTEDGKLSFEAYEPTVPAGTLELFDEDYYPDWKVKKEDAFVRNKIRVQFDQNPKTQEYKSVERNNYEVLHKYGVRDTLTLKTYIKNKADAETIAGGVRVMCSKPITIVETSFGIKGFKLFPTRKVKITRERAADTSGKFEAKIFRVRRVEKDTALERTHIIGMDDLQTLGEVFCYVCFSCQNCVTAESSCTNCYTCELCNTAQGGCAICVSCELCNTDQGGCQVCNTCQSCNTCQVEVGACGTCQSCVSCQLCNTCELNVATCLTCQNCYGCQLCNVCESNVATCGTCESCVSCQACNTCQLNVVTCGNCQTCYTCQVSYSTCPGGCDTCNTCEACNTCQTGVQSCPTCQSCVSCQAQYACVTCDTCQSCFTQEQCSGCDVCDVCQASVTCSTCDTCQNCNTCQNCVTTHTHCATCEECVACQLQYGCSSCDTCQSCVSCQVCNTSEDCAVCDVCVSCQAQYSCGSCYATCMACVSCESCFSIQA